jgi:hypothetical protein
VHSGLFRRFNYLPRALDVNFQICLFADLTVYSGTMRNSIAARESFGQDIRI